MNDQKRVSVEKLGFLTVWK